MPRVHRNLPSAVTLDATPTSPGDKCEHVLAGGTEAEPMGLSLLLLLLLLCIFRLSLSPFSQSHAAADSTARRTQLQLQRCSFAPRCIAR